VPAAGGIFVFIRHPQTKKAFPFRYRKPRSSLATGPKRDSDENRTQNALETRARDNGKNAHAIRQRETKRENPSFLANVLRSRNQLKQSRKKVAQKLQEDENCNRLAARLQQQQRRSSNSNSDNSNTLQLPVQQQHRQEKQQTAALQNVQISRQKQATTSRRPTDRVIQSSTPTAATTTTTTTTTWPELSGWQGNNKKKPLKALSQENLLPTTDRCQRRSLLRVYRESLSHSLS